MFLRPDRTIHRYVVSGLACTRPEHSISPDTDARLILSDLIPAAVIVPDFDVRLQKSDSMKFSASMHAKVLSDAAGGKP